MPNMQRITWNGVALHGGPLPGYAASHGCVRMPYGFAEKLFDKTWIGMRVIISPDNAEPVEFSHPALFMPKRDAIAAAPGRADAKAKLDDAATAKDSVKAAQTRKADAAKAAGEAKLALEPVSVYISRATQKLYVRRNTHKPAPDGGGEVFATLEFPVTIRDPD